MANNIKNAPIALFDALDNLEHIVSKSEYVASHPEDYKKSIQFLKSYNGTAKSGSSNNK